MTADDFLAALPPELRAEVRLGGGEAGLVLLLRRDVPTLDTRLELLRAPDSNVLELSPGRGAVNAETLAEVPCPVAGYDWSTAFAGALAHELRLPLAVVDSA